MTGRKRWAVRALALLVLLLTAAPLALAAAPGESGEKRVVRVAYPIQKYLTEIDENGSYYGYSYDYLKKVAEFANWKLEYVTYPDLSLNDQIVRGLDMVGSGEADLMGVMLKNPGLEETYLYPQRNYGVVYTTLETLDTNFDVNETNFMQLDPLRIAVLKTAKSRNAELETFAKNTGMHCAYVYCDTMDEQIAALESGAADTLVKVSLTFLPGLKQIAEFAPRPYYFVSGKGNEELIAELDKAIDAINTTDPYFESRLRAKYFVNTTADFTLSDGELAYVTRNREIQVLLFPQYAPFSFVNQKDEPCGMSVSILNKIGERAGIQFRYHALSQEEEMEEQIASGDYDVIIGLPLSDVFAENNGLILSQPYLETSLTMFINKAAEAKLKSDCVLALVREIPNPIGYPYREIRYYEDIQQCMEAVNRGEADYGYGSSYVVDFYTSQTSHKNLNYLNLSGYNREIGFYVPNTTDSELLSIINKYVRSMPTQEIHEALSLALSQRTYGGVQELIQNNPLLVIAVSVTFLFLLLLLVTLAVFNNVNQKRNQTLQVAFAAKSDFLSRMSHDMRTPMNGIIGLTGLTLEMEHLPGEVAENLSKIDESAQYLLSLINDTLDMNKIESNKIVLNMEPTNLHTFFDQMVSVARVSADQKKVHFIVSQSEKQLPLVYLDKVRVQQIFFNLISNAIKFTPENGTVEMNGECTVPEQAQVLTTMTIRDTGIGIDKDFLPRIFEPFEQEYNTTTANYAGTGLGLAIVKNLVDMMGGSITVKSEKGVGSEFTVAIRFAVAKAEETSAAPAPVSFDRLAGKRILLCEDHPLNAQIATKLLEKCGILVEHVKDGQAAVERFQLSQGGGYDAILMDIRMPVMDGLTATRTIRGLEQAGAGSIPIIAMTANAFDEDVQKSIDAGMNAHLAKPIEPTVLFQTLYDLICESDPLDTEDRP